MGLNPQDDTENQAGRMHKKKPSKVPNGLSLESCKNNHQQQASDQENNPQLAHKQGKRKKKHHKKKHAKVSYSRPYLSAMFRFVTDIWNIPCGKANEAKDHIFCVQTKVAKQYMF